MLVYQAGLERKQAFLFRAVDIAMELFALTAAVTRAHRMAETGHAEAASAASLADVFARGARRRVIQLLHDLWRNDDALKCKVASHVLDGGHLWLEQGIMPLGFSCAWASGGGAAWSAPGAPSARESRRSGALPPPSSDPRSPPPTSPARRSRPSSFCSASTASWGYRDEQQPDGAGRRAERPS